MLERPEHRDRFPALHEQRLVIGEAHQRAFDRLERRLIAGGLPTAAVHHEVVRPLGDVRDDRLLRRQRSAASCSQPRHSMARRPPPTPISRATRHRFRRGEQFTVRTASTVASISGDSQRSVPGPATRSRNAATAAAGSPARASGARRSSARAARSAARSRAPGAARRPPAQLAAGGPAHRDVVLLHRRARDRVDARRRGEPLQLADHAGLGVLRDHEPGVDARVVRRGTAAGRASGATSSIRSVRRSRSSATSAAGSPGSPGVADRRAVEVAVGLDPAVGQHHRVVDRRRQLAAGDQRGVVERCRGRRRRPAARTAASRRPAPGVLRAGVRRDDRRIRRAAGACWQRRVAWPGMRPQRLQVPARRPGRCRAAPRRSSPRRGRRSRSSGSRSAQASMQHRRASRRCR